MIQNLPISPRGRIFRRLAALELLFLLTASSAFPGALEASSSSPSFQAVQNETGSYVPTESPFDDEPPSACEEPAEDPWDFDELGRLTDLSPVEPEPRAVNASTSAQSYIK